MSTTAPSSGSFASDLQLVVPPRTRSAGEGVTWIGEGWRLFAKAPLMWIVSVLVLFVLAIVVSLVPIIGSIAWQIISPAFSAGFMVACYSLERGGEFEIEHVFAGFKTNFGSLVILGLLFLVGWILILVVVGMISGMGIVMALVTGSSSDVAPAIMASGMLIVVGMLVMLLLMVPLLMAYWFAPALIVLNNMAPVEAMKTSFSGCLRNLLSFLVYGIVMLLLCIVAVIPFGLGMLVWIPLAITSSYAAYRAIFTEVDTPTVPATATATV
jgi:uncharacterized membrane protein